MANSYDDLDPSRADRFGAGEGGYEHSQCGNCAHWTGKRTCEAFGDREIPFEILANEFDHRENHPDDNGLTWTPEDDGATHPFIEWAGVH